MQQAVWLTSNIVQGVHDKTNFDAAIKKRYPHYDVLKDVMKDMHHSKVNFDLDEYQQRVGNKWKGKRWKIIHSSFVF